MNSCSYPRTQSWTPHAHLPPGPHSLSVVCLDVSCTRKTRRKGFGFESVLCLSLQSKFVTLPSFYIPGPTFFISSPTPPPPCLLLDLRTLVCASEKGTSSDWMQPHARCVSYEQGTGWILTPACPWARHSCAEHAHTVM